MRADLSGAYVSGTEEGVRKRGRGGRPKRAPGTGSVGRPRSKDGPKKPVTVKLTRELRESLDRYAKSFDKTRTEVVEEAIRGVVSDAD